MTATAFRPAAAHGLNKVARRARTEPACGTHVMLRTGFAVAGGWHLSNGEFPGG